MQNKNIIVGLFSIHAEFEYALHTLQKYTSQQAHKLL